MLQNNNWKSWIISPNIQVKYQKSNEPIREYILCSSHTFNFRVDVDQSVIMLNNYTYMQLKKVIRNKLWYSFSFWTISYSQFMHVRSWSSLLWTSSIPFYTATNIHIFRTTILMLFNFHCVYSQVVSREILLIMRKGFHWTEFKNKVDIIALTLYDSLPNDISVQSFN